MQAHGLASCHGGRGAIVTAPCDCDTGGSDIRVPSTASSISLCLGRNPSNPAHASSGDRSKYRSWYAQMSQMAFARFAGMHEL